MTDQGSVVTLPYSERSAEYSASSDSVARGFDNRHDGSDES